MAEPDDYVYCNNDQQVYAGNRTSYKTAGWWTTNVATGGMCRFGGWSVRLCAAHDVREWFAAAAKYIRSDFKPHFERYKSHIEMAQGAPNVAQQQIMKEAQDLLNGWDNYAKHYKRGGGGPVGATFQVGGYSWDAPNDADPEGPGDWDFIFPERSLGLSKEIVDYYDAAACLRDKFNDTKPEGMLPEAPGYGSVTKRPGGEAASSEGMGTMEFAMLGIGAWIVIKALSE